MGTDRAIPYFSADRSKSGQYILWEPTTRDERDRITDEVRRAREWSQRLVLLLGAVIFIMPLCFLVSTYVGLVFTTVAALGAGLLWTDDGLVPPMVNAKSMTVTGEEIRELRSIAEHDRSLLPVAHAKTWQHVKLSRARGDEKVNEALAVVRGELDALLAEAISNRHEGDVLRDGREVADEIIP